MKYLVTLEGRTWEIAVDGRKVTVNGREYQAELRVIDATPVHLLILDGRTWSFPMQSSGGGFWSVLIRGELRELEALDERTAHIRSLAGAGTAAAGPRSLKAPMPGLVVRVQAEPGQKVLEGTSLIVLEAMKMENELKAAASGTVSRVTVRPGQAVEKGEVLIEFHSA